jgi:hypothetical protein
MHMLALRTIDWEKLRKISSLDWLGRRPEAALPARSLLLLRAGQERLSLMSAGWEAAQGDAGWCRPAVDFM